MLMAVELIGGLGLFIFGILFMGEALQKSTGSQLQTLINKLVNNKMTGILTGILVTVILQSSSATTVMTVGFVNAGLMSLNQSIGIIMGSNIGTTLTTQLISFNFDSFSPLIVSFGVLLYLVSKNKAYKNIANGIIGFGILFLGMSLMKESMKPLRDSVFFAETIIRLNSPLIGLLVGLVITAILQSSAATAGLLIAASGSGMLTIQMAFPVILGSNIGTCVTAILSSVGSNKTAKRAAFIHVIIKTIGALFFLLFLRGLVEDIVVWITPERVERQIANAHTIFNVVTVLALYPFSNQIVNLSSKVIKGQDKKTRDELRYIDERLTVSSEIALVQSKKEILRLFAIVEKQITMSQKVLASYDGKICRVIFENEQIINRLEKKTIDYMVKLTGKDLNEKQIDKIAVFSRTLTDIERIADLAENLAEISVFNHENNMNFPDEAKEEINTLFDKVIDIFVYSRDIFDTIDDIMIQKVIKLDSEIKEMCEVFQTKHITRIKRSGYNTQTETVFLDALGNLERIGNHSKNIAQSVLRFKS